MTDFSTLYQACLPPWELAGRSPTTPVLLAFSGGADSVALLHILLRQREQYGFPLLLAHVEHGIRGEDSLRDRDFCVATAKHLGLEICVQSVDVPRLAQERGKGVEETAREVRYAFFAELMRQREIPVLVTAHHADDHLETVLFRLARNTSPAGLCGIAPVRPFESGVLVRPMLKLSKQMLLEFCREEGLEFVTDQTNDDVTYTRNRIRHEVIPTLESLVPNVAQHVTLMSEALRADEDLLSSMAKDFLQTHADQTGIDLKALQTIHASILRRALHAWVLEQTAHSPEAVHLQALTELIRKGDTEARVALPGEFSAYSDGRRLCLTSIVPEQMGEYVLPVAEGGVAPVGKAFRITVQKMDDEIKIHNLSTAPYIILHGDFDIITKDMLWRNRREGDLILLNGMHRKLRRLYAQKGISVQLRRTIPLLCRNGEVLWAPFVGCRDGFLSSDEQEGGERWLLQVHLKDEKA
ncbi:MAG: tRNA lysidine(34) synthetase TilS [Clostridia bacterium]|nr:tRNA lysidine(34) synthetase TilS [Clostridia bacterium]